MTGPIDLAALARAAETAIGGRPAYPTRLSSPRVIADRERNVVVRCTADPPIDGADSVVVKWFRPGADLGFVEWASLAFLAGVPPVRGVVPGFVAGDAGRRFLVVEDLGDGVSLDDVLTGADLHAARSVLRRLAVAYARLHGGTVGAEDRFDRVCAGLPGEPGPAREREAVRWSAGRSKVEAWLGAVGVEPRGLGDAMRAVAEAYRAPGAWLAFGHGDPAPSNNHLAGDAVRLLDFEYGAFRHALYDLTAWDVLCPLPAPLVADMRRAYRTAVAAAIPPAAADEPFALAWETMVAYRALAMLTWIPPAVIEADAPWVGEWSRRRAAFVAASRLARAASAHPGLAPFARAAGRFADSLAGRWPAAAAAPVPRWPALAGLR